MAECHVRRLQLFSLHELKKEEMRVLGGGGALHEAGRVRAKAGALMHP